MTTLYLSKERFFFPDVKKLASVIVKQWMSLVRNQSGNAGKNTALLYLNRPLKIKHGVRPIGGFENREYNF